MATPKWYLRYPEKATMTPRLRETNPKPGLVRKDAYAKLEAEADRLLVEAGFADPGSNGVRDSAGLQVLSLDDEAVTQGAEPVSIWKDDQGIGELVETVVFVCELTRREEQIVQAILEGALWGPQTGGYAVLALKLSTTAGSVRVHWTNARKKLVTHWTAEDDREPYRVTYHRHATQGTGFTMIKGGDRSWGPRFAGPAPAEVRTRRAADSDWIFRSSLDPEGWPLA